MLANAVSSFTTLKRYGRSKLTKAVESYIEE